MTSNHLDGIDPDVLSRVAAERPRLMATKSAIGRTRQSLHQSDTARQWYGEVEGQAKLLLDLPLLGPNWVHDPRETRAAPLPLVRPPKSSDGPAAPLDVARLFCLRIQTLGLMWLITGDARYCRRAKAQLLAVCAFPDWRGDKFLVTAETAFGAAIGYDWLYDSLTDNERRQIAQAIVEKAIQPGLDEFAAPRPPCWATAAVNWYLVCNGALMIAALSVAEFDPRAARLFALCCKSISTGFHEYGPDGGWAEGPGYWHYATQYRSTFLTAYGQRSAPIWASTHRQDFQPRASSDCTPRAHQESSSTSQMARKIIAAVIGCFGWPNDTATRSTPALSCTGGKSIRWTSYGSRQTGAIRPTCQQRAGFKRLVS